MIVKITFAGFISFEARISPNNFTEVQFVVKDSGIGIPEEKIYQIFQLFSDIDKKIENNQSGKNYKNKSIKILGIHLGLFVTQTLARRMSGKITVKSRQGKGSTFIFTFPITTIKPEQKKVIYYFKILE